MRGNHGQEERGYSFGWAHVGRNAGGARVTAHKERVMQMATKTVLLRAADIVEAITPGQLLDMEAADAAKKVCR